MTTKSLTRMAVLTAAALTIFIIESQIPVPVPIPGVKLGLANIITLFALFSEPGKENKDKPATIEALMILLCRIVLGAIFTGRIIAFAYSLTGGLLSFAVTVALRRFVTDKQIWVCGAFGAVAHNIGQIIAAAVITATPAIAAYLPVLIIAGVITGVVTGFAAQLTIIRLNRAGKG